MAILEMSVIDLSGDTKVRWDPSKPAEVAAARHTFDTLRGSGYQAHFLAGKRGNKTGEQMGQFDPTAEGLVMVPVMTAG